MKLDRVTITGADDSIKPTDLLALSKKYPFVEWGILLSLSQQGGNRYPSYEWMGYLSGMKSNNPDLKLSAHLCGRYVRDLVERGVNSFREKRPVLWADFERLQLNFHGQWHKISKGFLDALPEFKDKQVIFQVDGVNDAAWAQCQNYCDAVPFFDASHGAGVTPTEWPSPYSGVYNGYGGGLGPHNLSAALDKISALSQEGADGWFWVDMETKVRSRADTKFDLEKVERCLEAAAPFVSQKD